MIPYTCLWKLIHDIITGLCFKYWKPHKIKIQNRQVITVDLIDYKSQILQKTQPKGQKSNKCNNSLLLLANKRRMQSNHQKLNQNFLCPLISLQKTLQWQDVQFLYYIKQMAILLWHLQIKNQCILKSTIHLNTSSRTNGRQNVFNWKFQ